jgi:hypothetical protein
MRKSDKMLHASNLGSWYARFSLGLMMLPVIAGCNSAPHNHAGDPLFGEYYPKGPNGQPMPPPAPSTQKTAAAGVPPYPLNNSATSTAAIAGNTSLTGARNLSINEQTGAGWALTNTANSGAASAAPSTGTPVVQPIPRDTTGPVAASPGQSGSPAPVSNQLAAANLAATSTTGNTIIPTGALTPSAETSRQNAAPATPMGVVTPEILQGTLQGKGALALKKENIPEGVRVSCYVPQKANPANLRYLETVAPDYTTGLQALLQQIDR